MSSAIATGQAVASVLAEGGDLTGKILIDVSNPITADYKQLLLGNTTSAAEEIQKVAAGAHVVQAFNTIFAGLISPETRASKKMQIFVAGDDAERLRKYATLPRRSRLMPSTRVRSATAVLSSRSER
ncbi:hypothetical protein SAMN05216228_10505 [Rhizobium tibeticum]|uniref:Uncharacterized protein n=1 Tax=Rhizobium tibeticum TaxID=501024 RepID=A0A1H8VZK7_9HYPH|nr:hypothetical protein [Rhizobium tibeticum]SEI20006.1 hypothetical protein RTCCBAU85039_6293 [Rhizobium tibeticum]SEP20806.1 hypothetical protein SAMN05216228_10505 [Rhizobium tibeticum]